MPILLKDASQINNDILTVMQNNTNLSRVAIGTLVQGIVSAVNQVLTAPYDAFNTQLPEVYLSSAHGDSLDFLGAMLGLKRGSPSVATRANVQRFYVLSGTLGDVTNISSLNNTIPAGTIVQTLDSTIQYRIISSVHFEDTDTQVFATIEAINTGESSNVGLNTLTSHLLPNVVGILTTNIAPINNGSGRQSDGDYRAAIAVAITAAEAANEIAIRLAALATADVADVRVIPYFRGVGTFAVIIVGTTPVVSQATLNNVLALVQRVTALGELVLIRGPRYIGIEMKAHLTFDRATSEIDKANIAATVSDTLFDYFNNIPMGTDLIRERIIQQILNVSTQIIDVDDDPTSPTVLDIATWTPSTTDIVAGVQVTNRIREMLRSRNYSAFFDDKIIAETDVEGFTHASSFNPILLTWD